MSLKKVLDPVFATRDIDTRHIGVLDGIRALSIIFVCGFHFWQQSWLWNLSSDKPFSWIPGFFKSLGVENVSLNWLYSCGYVFVDMMILLTGLCLFLPYANAMLDKTKLPGVGRFYLKRVARIFPSYYFCIAVLAIFFVSVSSYGGNVDAYNKDLFTHLSFTHMFFKETYLTTKFNGVLWTLCVEMMFYIIFPLLAYLFTKAPLLTYLGMNGVSLAYYILVIRKHVNDMSFYVNRFPTFLCVFANGMMAALLITALAKRMKQNKYTGLLFTLVAIFSLYILRIVLKYGLATTANGQFWQVQNRFLVSIIFTSFIIGATFSFNWFRAIFSNPVARFLSTISFNLYIWHQFLSVKLKEWHIPMYVSESGMPQTDAGREWQWKYTAVCWIASILVATVVTFVVEKPLHKLITKGIKIKKKPAAPEAVTETPMPEVSTPMPEVSTPMPAEEAPVPGIPEEPPVTEAAEELPAPENTEENNENVEDIFFDKKTGE
ncbi:MAG: acyltransferase family protein [Clostridia bacterium]|nr:acyltransferase family protein [Clostridia bacterium]